MKLELCGIVWKVKELLFMEKYSLLFYSRILEAMLFSLLIFFSRILIRFAYTLLFLNNIVRSVKIE